MTTDVHHPADLFTPLRISLYWLTGSFVGFLLLGEIGKVDNLFWLTSFVIAATASFAIGYWVRASRYRSVPTPSPEPQLDNEKRHQIKTLVTVGALYYLAYGLVYAREYGVANLGAVTSALANPGGAYLAKFDVYERQQALGEVNTAAQLLTLAAVLSTPLVPFLIVYWKHITANIRILAGIGLAAYAAFFLSIGTLSGLGQTVIFTGAALLVVRARGSGIGRQRRRGVTVVGLIAALGFVAYMSYNQGARLTELGDGAAYRFEPNPIVERLTGDQFARGLTVTAFYPTHGYQGLAYNLQTPFEWTHGQGAARAFDSYVAQYGFSDSVEQETYPARTEARTGWPAGQVWATIYPWLASDLTWFGVLAFMFLVGWWTARWWFEAVYGHSRLALLLLCQAALLIAFIPANNQIGLSRPNLVAAVTLLALYALSHLGRAALESRPRARLHAISR